MSEDLYKIGAVAKRTGISPECLRAWERRYGWQPAERAGKTRFYSASQVERLGNVKTLLDQGHPISQLIQLTDAELERRLRPQTIRPGRPGACRPRTGLVGGQLLLAHREATRNLETGDVGVDIIAEWASAAEFRADQGALPALDCLVVYVSTLDTQYLEEIEEICPEVRFIVAFRYATNADLEACRQSGRAVLRWPAEWQTLVRRVSSMPEARLASRRYSDEELVHISLMASRAGCECPLHLAELVVGINDFEMHARRCGRRYGTINEDHRLVAGRLAAARAQLEESLSVLVEKHGLLAVAN